MGRPALAQWREHLASQLGLHTCHPVGMTSWQAAKERTAAKIMRTNEFLFIMLFFLLIIKVLIAFYTAWVF
jgi:hypothetical protein